MNFTWKYVICRSLRFCILRDGEAAFADANMHAKSSAYTRINCNDIERLTAKNNLQQMRCRIKFYPRTNFAYRFDDTPLWTIKLEFDWSQSWINFQGSWLEALHRSSSSGNRFFPCCLWTLYVIIQTNSTWALARCLSFEFSRHLLRTSNVIIII